MDFRSFFIPYIFEVEESISRKFTKLPCSGDLENPGQLPVSQVLEGTDDWVLWIFVISSFPTFSRSRNPFLAKFTKLKCSGDLENPGQLPASQVLKGTDDWVLWIFVISSYPTYIFEVKESVSRSFTKIPCSDDLKNLDQLPVLHVLEGAGDVV